ncbi:hypothetical protein HPB52_007182 [Rhipicephalus sanguineus]|uniref:Uncharacterized protein n=1 Tax=Rhipicephalus sanguineus TaxID=34632 RepID=A0A9D4T322_RHISA|nr:hypothetical protein HPB52_007182 [Rhipicephalus sanguineus]
MAIFLSVERDALRERERQARALRAGVGGGDSGGHPIFRAPIKVDPGQEDELSRRIKNTLGDFNQVQRLLSHDPNHLIGISRTNAAAQTRAPPAVSNPVNGSSSTASTWNGNATAGKNSRHLSQPPQGSSHHHHQSRGSSHEQVRLEDAASNPKASSLPASSVASSAASTTNPPMAPSSQGPPNGLVVRPPAMRAPSKDVNNGNSSASAQHQSSTNSSSLTVRTESNGPATGSTKSSSAPRSSASDSKPKRPAPRLQISAPSSDSGTASTLPELETILKEMKKVPPVLTAIETPRKEECRPYFPTTPVQDPVPNHLDENGDSKHLLDPRKVASPP